ncbi:hypothetical protein [Profundibacter sp.]
MLKLFSLLLFGFVAVSASSRGAVAECRLVFLEKSSESGRQGLHAYVFTDYEGETARIEAGVNVAKRLLLSKTGYDYAKVFLYPAQTPKVREGLSFDNSVGVVEYAPDPAIIPSMKKAWRAIVSRQQYAPDTQEYQKNDRSVAVAMINMSIPSPADDETLCDLGDLPPS